MKESTQEYFQYAGIIVLLKTDFERAIELYHQANKKVRRRIGETNLEGIFTTIDPRSEKGTLLRYLKAHAQGYEIRMENIYETVNPEMQKQIDKLFPG